MDPATRAELDSAARSYRAYQLLAADPLTCNWAVVTLYYTALYLVRAHARHLWTSDKTVALPRTHDQGRTHVLLKLDAKLYSGYNRLVTGSMACRYSGHLPDEVEVDRFHDNCFVPIRDAIAALGVK